MSPVDVRGDQAQPSRGSPSPYRARSREHPVRRCSRRLTDITVAQARIAARIGPEGTRVSELAAQARVTKQSATFLVEQLEAAGYVDRVPDPVDRRARLVRLTARADEVVRAADAEVERVLAEWADHVGADRLGLLYEVLRDLREVTDPWR